MEWEGLRSASDREELEQLVKKHEHNLLQFIRHFIPNEADAEDVYQETLLDASRKWQRFKGYGNRVGWLFKAARISIKVWQRRHAREEEHRAYSLDEEGAAEPAAPERPPGLEELFTPSVTQKERSALIGFYEQGRAVSDLARREGGSEAAVRKRLERAREHLRRDLEREK